ncbi:putative MFS family arabinose efflux permease [Bradyrhizobium sp. LM4.3]
MVPTAQADQGPSFVLPRSIVLLLATIAAIAFLIEGAMLDWAALLVVGAGLAPKTQGGLAYVLFSIAMTVGRLAGDAVVERAGDRATLMFGSLLALAGFGALLAAPVAVIAMIGLLLIGLGLSNVAPILFRRAGTQEAMPVGPAIAAITTIGYAGILIGPAGMGFLAKYVGLPAAFGVLAGLMCLVLLLAPIVTANTR